jgi:nicotinamidase-related amidase
MPRSRASKGDLHGNAPDEARAALLIVDMINAFDFEGAAAMLPRALAAARAIHRLKRRAQQAGVPAIYVNDHFGRWRSDLRTLLRRVTRAGCRGKPLAELLRPGDEDYFVLKPKHSAFQFSALEILLEHLGARTLIITGVAGNFCVLFTAQDAYIRGYRLLVPRDCIASLTPADDRYALHHLAKVTKADVRTSDKIDLAALQGSSCL